LKKIIVLACVLALFAGAVALAGCGNGGGGDSESPEEVAQAFWTAALTGDADTSWELLSETMQSGLKDKATWAESVQNDPNASIEAGKATIEGDTAKVNIKILSSGKEVMDSDVSLVKEDGAWKVAMP
jgi:hypothetical protein